MSQDNFRSLYHSMLLLDIALLLLHGFGNFSNYGIHDYLPVACSVILCGFLRPTKFKIVPVLNNDFGIVSRMPKLHVGS